MKKIFLKFKRGFSCFIGLFFRLFKIKKNRIYFISNHGRFSCNPKAFFEFLYNNHKEEFDFYYCLNQKMCIGDDVKQAKFKTIKDFYYFYTSKYIISNQRLDKRYKKKKGQIYIQTWHGGPIPMKAIEGAVWNANKKDLEQAKKEGKSINALTVGSDDILSYYKKYFFCSGEFLNFGTPRYDTLINATKDNFIDAKKALGLPIDKEIVLIAPTFKNDHNIKRDLLDNKKIIDFFKEELNKEVVICYRFHPFLLEETQKLTIDNAINLTQVDDGDSVVFASDYIVTDFSSIIVDGLFAKKKCVCFSNYFEEYQQTDRDLWIDFDKFPFKFCKNEDELLSELKNLEKYDYEKIIKKVYKDYGITETGHASEKLYEYLKNYENKPK